LICRKPRRRGLRDDAANSSKNEPHFSAMSSLPASPLVTPGLARNAARAATRATASRRTWAALLDAPALGTAEAQALDAIAQVRSVAAGQLIYTRRDPAQSLVALIEGDAALGLRQLADGQFRIERMLHAPGWLDLASAWLSGTHALDAQAVSDVTLLELPRSALGPLVEDDPHLGSLLIQALAREVRILTLNTHELMHKDAPARLAAWLHQRCAPVPEVPGQGQVLLRERKRDIASQLAITPETLSRLMRSFMTQGVIDVAGYNVRVLDLGALRKLAQDEAAAA
jgi:CRP-like cAMP-binding protein